MNGSIQTKLTAFFNKFIFLTIALSVFLLPVFFVPQFQTRASILDLKVTLAEIIAGALLILLGAKTITEPAEVRSVSIINASVVLLGLSILLSSFLADSQMLSLKESMLPCSFLIMFMAARSSVKTKKDIMKIMEFAFLSAFIVVIIGILQMMNLDPIDKLMNFRFKEESEGRDFFLSTIGNPEYLGSYIAAIAALNLPFLLMEKNKKILIFKAMRFFVFIIGLLLSGSRGPVLGFLTASAIIIAVSIRTKQWIPGKMLKVTILASLLIGSVMLAILSFPNPLNPKNTFLLKRFEDLLDLRSESLSERIVFYCACTEMISETPVLGSGAGTFKIRYFPTIRKMIENDPHAGMTHFVYRSRNRSAINAHCDYLQIWVEFGIIGLALFILIILTIFYGYMNYLKEMKTEIKIDNFFCISALIAGIICMMVNAMFSFPLQMPVRASLFWILAGMSASVLCKYIPSYNWIGEKKK